MEKQHNFTKVRGEKSVYKLGGLCATFTSVGGSKYVKLENAFGVLTNSTPIKIGLNKVLALYQVFCEDVFDLSTITGREPQKTLIEVLQYLRKMEREYITN